MSSISVSEIISLNKLNSYKNSQDYKNLDLETKILIENELQEWSKKVSEIFNKNKKKIEYTNYELNIEYLREDWINIDWFSNKEKKVLKELKLENIDIYYNLFLWYWLHFDENNIYIQPGYKWDKVSIKRDTEEKDIMEFLRENTQDISILSQIFKHHWVSVFFNLFNLVNTKNKDEHDFSSFFSSDNDFDILKNFM